MNFLAHIALSGSSPELILGNFSGDYVKGKLDSEQKRVLPREFLKGVKLHRFIDHFTDTDETVKKMIKEVYHTYGRAASVATDIIFDHFLAKHFSYYHDQNLRLFVDNFHRLCKRFPQLIPESMQPLAAALIENDWLFKYREWVTVERTVRSMGKRYPFLSDFLKSSDPIRSKLDEFEVYFTEFYPRLQQAASFRLMELNEELP